MDVIKIDQWVDDAVATTPVYDLHTHLYPAHFGPLMLWGIDELLTYHYLIAEMFRASDIAYEQFWAMSKPQQADHIWRTLFIEQPPISEACRGVLTALQRLGLNVGSKNLEELRAFFRDQKPGEQVDRVLRLANVHTVAMTNDPFDPAEREIWLKRPARDPRFKAVLRIDPLLVGWQTASATLKGLGYDASADLGTVAMREVRRFLNDWIDRLGAIYVAASLPPTWRCPDDSPATRVIDEAILPVARERGLPLALMIGVIRQTNPMLRQAGDSLGRADVDSVERLCAANQQNKFLVTMLSRENQHELAVAARKHRNLMIFGCWWFLNNPSLIEEITRMRVELLGPSFIPQHSDARVLEQLIYKWNHSRRILGKVLKDKFADLAAAGWPVSESEVRRTVSNLLDGNFQRFLTTQ
jgi:hypothetical protein